jgi:RNA polymerase sigma-70 factor (ECF subfamily)
LGGDRPGAAVPAAPGPVFGRADFAKEFAGCSRAMWYIAAGILGDRSRAEDVVQDAALAAMQKLHEFQPGTSFLAWMGRFVRYTALNEARRQRMRAAAPLDESIAHTNSAGSPHRQVISASGQLIDDQSAFDDRVSSALKTLDDTARACLLLRTVLDMPYRQIAYALDIPEGTAMSHVHRSRQSLRSLLSKIDYPRGSTD